MAQPDAEVIALQALAFLAGDDDAFSLFLNITGLTPDIVKAEASSPGFQGAVLDYVLGNETLLMTFADENNLSPESIAVARRKLPGSSIDM
ncbi:MAG: DUF3572 domain-containing protein [Rhodospirillaceae bacterium]